MVKTFLRSTLREIRQSLGRYLAILAIVGLGVGFFAGLRMCQPSMMATGVDYLHQQKMHDFRLLSTLGFTQEDVDAFAGVEGVSAAHGAYFTDFLTREGQREVVLRAHTLTENIDLPRLTAGRMPESPNECLADAQYFNEDDLGQVITVAADNSEDTLDLLTYDAYTVVGLANSPAYLNYDRGTTSVGSGSVAAFLYIPEDGFTADAYYELYLTLADTPDPWSAEYQDRIDAVKPEIEALIDQRADLRYDDIRSDALEEIQDAEQEIADGWTEYRQERADAEQELADAHQELLDGEEEYKKGLADYEQGKLDYADGLKKYEDGVKELADAKQELLDAEAELADGKLELDDAAAQLRDAEQDLLDAEEQLLEAKAELDDAEAELADAKAELDAGGAELDDAEEQLREAEEQLDAAEAQLAEGKAAYGQLETLYGSAQQLAAELGVSSAETLVGTLQSGLFPELNAAVDGILQSQGSSLDQLLGGWAAAESTLGAPLNESSLAGMAAQLEQGQAEYEEGLREYRKGKAAYEDGLEAYQDGWRAYRDGLKQYEDGLAKYKEGRADYDEGFAEYQQGVIDYQKGLQEYQDGQAEYQDGLREYQDGLQELEDAKKELADAKRDLDSAPAELADARRELDDGWAEYDDGKQEAETEFADAEAELADGEAEVEDAYADLAELQRATTYVLTREENVGYACFDSDISIVAAISLVFPVFFFLVAALVCMTTMKRMVDEQRTQIGVLKALGYSNGQIMAKFLMYSGSAALIGSALGYAAGAHWLPWIIWEIYDMLYGFAPLRFTFDPVLMVISFSAALLCSMGATWLSCRVELRRPAAELIRPKAPKAGRRVFLEYITPLWRRLNFLHKVSLRNVFRYRSRLVMMVLGIGGCTALLLTGFGIRDSIKPVVDKQFAEITLYDYSVTFQDGQTQESAAAYLEEMGWTPDQGKLVHSGSMDVISDSAVKSVYQVVSASSDLEGFISLHSGDEAIPYPGPGEVVVNTGLAESLGVGVGDELRLRDRDLGTMTATVSAICDNYVFNYVYLSPETYRQQLGVEPDYETLYVHAHPEAAPFAEGAKLAEADDVSVTVNESTRVQVDQTLSRMDYVVLVVVVCAAALAFIVLYNLTNININERVREIATIKVLGFYKNEVSAYVFREINILAFIGSLVGLVMGIGLHAFVMAQVRIDSMFFPHYIAPWSYLLAFVITMLFTVLIGLGMRPRLSKVHMAESLKSIE